MDLSAGKLVLGEAGSEAEADFPFTVDAGGKIRSQDPKILKLTISSKNGLFKGSLRLPFAPTPLSVSGAVLQRENAGYGFYLGRGQTGPVLVGE